MPGHIADGAVRLQESHADGQQQKKREQQHCFHDVSPLCFEELFMKGIVRRGVTDIYAQRVGLWSGRVAMEIAPIGALSGGLRPVTS